MPNLVFVKKVEDLPAVSREAHGRVIFGVDATQSREWAWEKAKVAQAQMFDTVGAAGGLKMQLVYFRGGGMSGAGECAASKWHDTPTALKRIMDPIQCRTGYTQIGRVLARAKKENAEQAVAALMYVGDAFEEVQGDVIRLARESKVRCFMFQEGNDPYVEGVFRSIADCTGGAYAKFEHGKASDMTDLMNVVAEYATGRLGKGSGPTEDVEPTGPTDEPPKLLGKD